MLIFECEQLDLNALAAAFEGEFECDVPLVCEVICTSAEEIRTLNRQQRGVDSVTDVLSFPSMENIRGKALKAADFPDERWEDGALFLGSIAVCEERAREQAAEYGHSYERELNYLITHGVCHLLGYDHESGDDKAQMREKEERVLKKLGLSRGDE